MCFAYKFLKKQRKNLQIIKKTITFAAVNLKNQI